MRPEDPGPEPDIEWPGLAADLDGRRDIANAILADQSGADHGEARAPADVAITARSSRAQGHATALRASHRHNQAKSHTSAIQRDVSSKKQTGKNSAVCVSEHYETALSSPRDGFSAAVRIELFQNGGDVKLGSVKRDSKSTRNRFVGGSVCHRRQDFELAGR